MGSLLNYLLKACLFFIILLIPLTTCFSQTDQKPDAELCKGDDFYQKRAHLISCREAIHWYEQAYQKSPGEEVAVRLAKAYYWLGAHAHEKEHIELFQKGIDWSKKAIESNPQSVGGHFWLGVNYAKYGEAKGIFKSLFLVPIIKEEMQKVISIDPSYEFGGAFRVLGRMYFKLPGFAGGGTDKSIDYFKKALEYGPAISLSRLFLAEAYMKKKEYELAQQELNSVLRAPPQPGYEPEDRENKEAARRFMEELSRKSK